MAIYIIIYKKITKKVLLFIGGGSWYLLAKENCHVINSVKMFSLFTVNLTAAARRQNA